MPREGVVNVVDHHVRVVQQHQHVGETGGRGSGGAAGGRGRRGRGVAGGVRGRGGARGEGAEARVRVGRRQAAREAAQLASRYPACLQHVRGHEP